MNDQTKHYRLTIVIEADEWEDLIELVSEADYKLDLYGEQPDGCNSREVLKRGTLQYAIEVKP